MEAPFKRPSTEPIQFRLLCPLSRIGAIIGKGGSVVRRLQSLTGAKIRVIDEIPVHSDERIVLILFDSTAKLSRSLSGNNVRDVENPSLEHKQEKRNDSSEPNAGAESEGEEKLSAGQKALLRVLERIVNGDDDCSEESKREEEVVCRMLVAGNQAGFLLGRGGRVLDKIKQGSEATIRVLHIDQIPPCAFPGDELIQITGNLMTVKKALLSISSSLQESFRIDTTNCGPTRLDSFPQHGYAAGWGYPSTPGPDDTGGRNRKVAEEEVVFKLLCHVDKVGSLIGKGGSIIRALQNETGASIKIADSVPDSDERLVVISARENSTQRFSPAQDAVIRVQSRIAEIGFEHHSTVIARLLVQVSHIGFLLGKGGHIITEIRRATGANIRVFPKEQGLNYDSHSDEVVQVVGSYQCVQDALFHITGRLREAVVPISSPFPGPSFLPPFQEMHPPPFRPRHYPESPGHYHSRAIDHSPVFSQSHDHKLGFAHGTDRMGPSHFDHIPYGGERPGHPMYDRPPSPRPWTPQVGSDGHGHPWGMTDVSSGFAARNGPIGSEHQGSIVTNSMVEVVIPQIYLSHVYGENNSNLNHIRQISGANVIVHDPKPGATEGMVVVSGPLDKVRAAQGLIHAFILCELG